MASRKKTSPFLSFENLVPLAGSLVAAYTAGIIGVVTIGPSIATWYAQLMKPSFTPPNEYFGPIGLVLYTFMGVAAYLVWMKKDQFRDFALNTYYIHLVLNALWPILFFRLKDPLFALGELVLMFGLVLIASGYFWRIDKRAGLLMIPYIFWIIFGIALNLSFWWIN
jgi:tryptophan-rich sensory protein